MSRLVAGPDGLDYVIEARPSGVIGWQYGQGGPDLIIGLAVSLAAGMCNLVGRVIFGFGWHLRVSSVRTRRLVGRKRFRSKAQALTQLPQLAEEVRRRGGHAVSGKSALG